MKIISWNVNGVRAAAKKGLKEWIDFEQPDVLCLQEVKAFKAQLPENLSHLLHDYHHVWHEGQRPGYSGTAIFSKRQPIESIAHFGEREKFHEEGRVTHMEFPEFFLLNIYFPNGGMRADGTDMVPYKLDFYTQMREHANELRAKGKPVVMCGDFNVCHRPIDIARPEANKNSIGFLPIERAELDTLSAHNYVDVFRHLYPDTTDAYTWWTYRGGARERNVGWRIDYFWVSDDILPVVKNMSHHTHVMGSDHCPIELSLDL